MIKYIFHEFMKSFDIKHTLNFSCLFTICNFAPTKAKSRSNKRSNVRQGKTVVLTSSSYKAFLEESKQAKTRKVQVNKDRSAQIKVPRQTKDNKGNKRTTTKSGSQMNLVASVRKQCVKYPTFSTTHLRPTSNVKKGTASVFTVGRGGVTHSTMT